VAAVSATIDSSARWTGCGTFGVGGIDRRLGVRVRGGLQLAVLRLVAACGIAAGEDQVDHREDAREPLGQEPVGGDFEADSASRALR
jgi:hypothetical protein